MDYSAIASAFQTIAKSGTQFVYILSVAVGIALVLSALISIVKKGGRHAHHDITWGFIVGRLLIGALLTTLGFTLGSILTTMGSPTEVISAFAYVQNSNSDATVQAIWGACKAWCIFIGTIAFFRGFLLLDRSTRGGREGGDDVWRAFWHILGGAVTVQIFSSF